MSIDFLCPNGHRLSGPDHLQGRAGQCPHCGEKFEIPIINDPENDFREDGPAQDEPDEEEPIEDSADKNLDTDENLDTIDFADAGPPDIGRPDAGPLGELDDEPEMFDDDDIDNDMNDKPIRAFDEEADDDDDLVVSFASDDEGPMSPAEEIHPLRDLFELLWEEKQHGASVLIFLADDDDPFEPQWYSPALSQASHALFAGKETDGKYTLTAIAWDAMERIEVGKLDELPEGAFE